MRRLFLATFAFLAALGYGAAHAQSEVYLCVDENGKKEYKNTGLTKGCKKVDLPGITMIPAPASVKKAQAQAQQTAAARPVNTPSDFPRIDSGTQKARDSDKKQILLDELRKEELRLSSLKTEFNNGEPERRGDERNYAKYQERVSLMKEDIERSEKNVEALKRELGNMK